MVLISPEICTELTTLAESHTRVWRDEWPDALARSVGSLAHEAAHVSGIRDEAKADCYGLQWIVRAARMLARTHAEGAVAEGSVFAEAAVAAAPTIVSKTIRNRTAISSPYAGRGPKSSAPHASRYLPGASERAGGANLVKGAQLS